MYKTNWYKSITAINIFKIQVPFRERSRYGKTHLITYILDGMSDEFAEALKISGCGWERRLSFNWKMLWKLW